MKKTSTIASVAGVAFLLGAVTAQAYLFDRFESSTSNASWITSGGVLVSNVSGDLKHDVSSFFIPSGAIVSNVTSTGNEKVWTDFYTRPRPYSSIVTPVPAVDLNSTAQFYVNTNGLWVTISGNNGGGLITNVCANALIPGVTYPTVTTDEVLYHVSVLHDYTASPRRWSLFVQDIPLATNLYFINDSVTGRSWFQAQNVGGDPLWMDDFLVTNRVASGTANALTNTIIGTDIPISLAMMGFGSLEDPRPTNDTVGASGTAVNFQFGRVVNDGRRYVVLGTANYTLAGLSSNGLVNPVSGLYTDDASLVGTGTRSFYKIVTVSEDGNVVITNNEVYAAYKQYRSPSASFIVGVPVQYADPADRTMAGAMGDQLMSGLANDDEITITTNGSDFLYTLNAGEWSSVKDPDCDKIWGQGVGMVVKRSAVGGATASVLAGLKDTNAVQVAVANNAWSYLTWPHDDKAFNNGSVLGFSASIADYIYIQTNGAANFIPARFDGTTWKTMMNGAGPALSLTLRAGDGIVYRTVGGAKVFTSNGP